MVLLATAALSSSAGAFYQCAAHASGGGDAPESQVGTAPVLTGMVSLKLRIDTHNSIQLLDQVYLSGTWTDKRIAPMGTRLYYEVVDVTGRVVSQGYRKDPRDMIKHRSVEFLLNAPCTADSSRINLYLVDYESSGRDGYSRDYRLVGSFPVNELVATAAP